MSPFFSVVIPVYNRAKELRSAVESVLAQIEQDFEVIVIDDGSNDNPQRTVLEIGDPRVSIVRQDNLGGAAARNAGIGRAQGQFVAFLDSDDAFLRGHLAEMKRLLVDTTDVAAYAPVVVRRNGGSTFQKPPRALGPNEHMANYVLCDRGFVPTSTFVVATHWARRVRYDEGLAFAQDTDFCIRLFLAGCRFVMADAPGAIWNDVFSSHRVSAGRKGGRMIAWLERIRPEIPPRAYHGARGWMIAKGVAPAEPVRALKLYLAAVFRGCYRPRLAAMIFLQIFFPDVLYRWLVDGYVRLRRGAVWAKSERLPRQLPAN